MARKADPIREYMAAHPDRVHQGAVPAPERTPKPSRARDAIEASSADGRYSIAGWCSITHEPVYSLAGESLGKRWADHGHEGRRGCVILNRVVEGADGRWYAVEPEWDKIPGASNAE